MSLRLIIGRANTGKSTLTYKEITELVEREPDGPPLWLLVPEQATFQAEQALAARLGGIMRARVVSFRRLAHIVMNEVAGAALTPISDLGRRMLVRKVIEEHKRELKLFARAASHPGFADKIVELISELKRYRITPVQLKAALDNGQAKELPSLLRNKLYDLSIIYDSLNAKHQAYAFDSEDCLDWLAEHVHSFRPLWHTQIWIDGFSGFSPQEYSTIERLLAVSDVHLSLTMDPSCINQQLAEGHPFYSPWETATKLRALAAHTSTSTTLLALGPSSTPEKRAALSYLEQSYFSHESAPFIGPADGLAIVAAATRRCEVEASLREIVRLCREEGYRYRDFCIVVRDAALYEPLIKTIFGSASVPVFIDKKRQVRHHPLLDLMRAALEAVLQDFPYEPTLRCLKSDLFNLSREVIDHVDNFALATGLKGRRWLDDTPWRIPKGLRLGCPPEELTPEINAARQVVGKHFRALETGLNQATNVAGYVQALYAFLEGLAVPRTLEAWAQQAMQEGDLDTAGLHVQVFEAVSQLLQEMETTLGEEKLLLPDFARILETGLDGIKLGLIPPSVDQVIVAELGRSRSPVVRGAFVLGANEGVMPAKSSGEGLISDDEREYLSAFNVRLGPSARRKLFEEEYLIYMGLTRPNERLYVSYALGDESGAPLAPSLVVKRIQELFPQLIPLQVSAEPGNTPEQALSYMEHYSNAAGLLAEQLSLAKNGAEVSSLWWDVYSCLLEHPTGRKAVSKAVRGLFHRVKVEPLSERLVSQLYGKTIRGSVSRLERFNACPFSYFAAYGLRLEERPIYKLAAVDLGNFFHEALDRFVDTLRQKQLDWAALSQEQYKEITQSVVTSIIPDLDNDILQSTARYRHLTQRLQQVIERSARVLGRHAARGAFRPLAVEIGFGGANDALPALKIELSDGTTLEMAGRIDRIDTAEADGRLYLRIIDYKSGHSKLTPLEVYYGLKIQLLTYLEVALVNALELVGREAMPAGALYFRLQDPLLTSDVPLEAEVSEELALKDFKHSGIVVAENEAVELMERGLRGWSQILPIMAKADGTYSGDNAWDKEKLTLMLRHIRSLLKHTGLAIAGGNIDVAPYRLATATACRYCDYLPVCQFDTKLTDGMYRELKKMTTEEVWSIVRAEGREEA